MSAQASLGQAAYSTFVQSTSKINQSTNNKL